MKWKSAFWLFLSLAVCGAALAHPYTQSELDTYDDLIRTFNEAADNKVTLQAALQSHLELPVEEQDPVFIDWLEFRIAEESQIMVNSVVSMQAIWDDHGHGP